MNQNEKEDTIRIKRILENKKEDIKKSFKGRLTYDKWDKKSPIYAYCILTDEVEKIDDVKRIKYLLQLSHHYVTYFLNKEDLDTYKWLRKTIEEEIDNMILESFSTKFENFVSEKDIALEDSNVFYVSDYEPESIVSYFNNKRPWQYIKGESYGNKI